MDELRLDRYPFRWRGVALDLLTAPDLDVLVTDRSDPDRLPFWVTIWDSAAGMARWVSERGAWEATRVLELGCGPGLVGLAAAARGARVTQTDLFPEAVRLARRNAEANGLTDRMRHAAADWRAWPFRTRWPLVLGSDITYERGVHAALLETLERALTVDGEAWLADPGRPMSLDFLALAEARGWEVQIHNAPPVAGLAPVYLYCLRPGSD